MKILQRFSFFLGLSLVLPFGRLCAQVGGDNPTGPFGIFNGNVTTGCSYDPYTGNVMRSIPDISVAGAVGRYGLGLSRTYNSRNGGGVSFGYSGWRHSYEWTMDDSPITNTHNAYPTSYSANFPDGRHETFTYSGSDIYFRSGAGIRERLQPLNLGSMFAYLILPDGGYVAFKATQVSYQENCCPQDGCPLCTFYYYTYVAQAIVDPYGQITTLTYDGSGRLTWVTEPAGRTLQFYYVGSSTVLDHVTGSDGRTVQYNYSVISPGGTPYTALVSVVYYGYGDATWTARYQYRAPNAGVSSGVPLLWTCDDPMYPGPMRRIGYTYATGNNADGSAPVYGQILSENYYDGTNVLVAVTILTVNNNTRTEARADSHTRTFTYTNAMLTSATDFRAVAASQGYDSNGYINLVTDRNGHATNFTCNALTGGLTQVIYPLTSDTPGQTQRPTVTYTYGWAGCPDPNNRDANNPYYLYSVTDEGGHATVFTRDAFKRVIRIDYPDGGYETFGYDNNTFGEVTSHRMTTGGTEYFSYDSRGLKLDYRDPDHTYGTPSARYQYDLLDRLSGVTDALGTGLGDVNHTMSYSYNSRGQLTVTTFPTDPVDGQRHTVINVYNPDGTLASTTDQLSHTTSFTYDEYRRPSTLTTPQRFAGNNTPRTTYTYYGSGTGNDYSHTDSNVTHVTLPSGNQSTTTYNANLQKTSVTIGAGTGYAATTSYGYDNVGNVTSVISPNEQYGGPYYGQSTVSVYDERNRLMSVWDALNNPTSFQYDTSGRKKTVTRANGQVISYDSYDSMNRLLQQTVKQTPNPDAVTRWTWFHSGSMNTMVDPRSNTYTYAYDDLKRCTMVTYPPDSGNAARTETYTYDTVGNLATFKNRAGDFQTFQYDNRNRETRFDWSNNAAVSRTLVYDAASNMTWCTNGNAAIAFTYNNDNTLAAEEEWTSNYGDNNHRILTYTYDPDGHRATMQYPSGRRFNVSAYTPRGEPQTWYDATVPGSPFQVYYTYDASGNRTHRYLDNWQAQTDYTIDGLNRTASVLNTLHNTYAVYNYAYDEVSNRRYEQRNGGTGDGYSYDLSGQVTGFQRDGTVNPDGTVTGGTVTLFTYDESGNREAQWQGGTTNHTANNLNQYSAISGFAAPTYDNNGNLQTYNNWYYTYDAQNRLTGASNGTTLAYFWYDGLNRQCTRTINGNITFSVWDGWDLAEEYRVGNILDTSYMHGAGSDELVSMTRNGQTYYFFQDGLGSTSQLADSSGNWVESYSYDLHGRPSANSAYNNRFLFTGREWYAELGLYNYRNRFYHPDLGRFLQADPIGFGGDATNLYRYCGNNPANRSDPSGTTLVPTKADMGDFLDIGGYHGPDGTGSVSFDTTGIDITGVSPLTAMQADEIYASSLSASGIRLSDAFAALQIPIGPGGIATFTARNPAGFNIDPQIEQEVNTSLDYISRYGPEADVVHLLYMSGSVNITSDSKPNGGFDYKGTIGPPNTVYWNPSWAPNTADGQTMYPALVLGHELDHALDFLQTGYNVGAMNARTGEYPADSPLAPYNNFEEYHVITGLEAATNAYLGQPVRFDHQRHGSTYVSSPIPPGG